MGKNEQHGAINDLLITEFRGQMGKDIPEVATYDDVDVAQLTTSDADPFYATLKIAEVGRISDNGLHYDEDLVASLEKTMKTRGVTGGMGHIDPQSVDLDFPASEIYWIGSERAGDTLWAKGYLPPGPAREEVRRRKAANSGIATSIWGRPEKRIERTDGSYNAVNFDLLRLDLAPAERAALNLDGTFEITKETKDKPEDAMKEKAAIIAELTANDASTLPGAVTEAIIAEYRKTADSEKVLTTLTQERDDLKAKNGELEGVLVEMANTRFEENVDSLIAELTSWEVDEAHKPLVISLRAQVKRALTEKLGKDRSPEKIEAALSGLWEAEFKPLAEAIISQLSGPRVVLNSKSKDKDWRKEMTSPEGLAALKKEWGG